MKGSLLVRAIVLSVALFSASAKADVYKAGDSFAGFQAADQHGISFTFKPGDASFILVDTPDESGSSEPPKDPDWFSKHRAILIVNLTDLSSFKRRIARSRLESKPFRALVVDDKSAAEKFPKQKGKFTVLMVDESGKITDIRFAAPGKELQEIGSEEKPSPPK